MTPRLTALLESAAMAFILGACVFVLCALSITFDIHQTRVDVAAATVETRREILVRIDAFRWKADTALEIAAAARLDLGNLLTKIRAQVKQSSEESTHAATVQAKAATIAVTKALDKTSEAIQAAAGDSPVSAPEDTSKAPITVNVPPPVVMSPEKPAGPPQVEIIPRPVKRRRWFTRLWHWW